MADQIPLRIVTVSGQPFIGEFQSGDTVGLVHGGTGVSSLALLKTEIGINSLSLSDSLTDVFLKSPFPVPSTGDSLVWQGGYWQASAVTTGGGGGGVTDHSGLNGLTVGNDHPQYVLSATNNNLSSLVTSVETSTTNLSSVLGNHIASGSVHFTEASIDHGSIAGLADDDHTQYARVDGSRNINTQNFSDTYAGTVGDTSLGFGIETTGNLVNKAGNYVMFSATTGYQFRVDGETAYTNTSLPDTMRNWDEAYNQLNTSFYPSFIQLKEVAGGQNINQASKQYVQFDTVDNSGGAASTDFTHNGSDTITINTAGTYEITVNLSVSAQGTGTSNQRTCQNIRIEKDGSDIGPMLATGYIRITSQHETASYTMAPYTMTLAATDVLKLGSTRENSQTGGVGTMGQMCFWTIRRIL